MIPSNDEMRSTKVLSDNRMPNCFPGSSHPHSKGQKSKSTHSIGVFLHDSLIHPNSRVMVDITWLGEPNYGVDEDVGLALSGGADGEFAMGSVHWVTGLECHDFAPC